MSRKRWKANSYPSFIKNDPAANLKTFENLIDSWDIAFMRSHDDGFIPTPSEMSELENIFQELNWFNNNLYEDMDDFHWIMDNKLGAHAVDLGKQFFRIESAMKTTRKNIRNVKAFGEAEAMKRHNAAIRAKGQVFFVSNNHAKDPV